MIDCEVKLTMAKSKRGFASMNPSKQREIARKGGLSGGPGRGWKGNRDGHARAGKLGGLARRNKSRAIAV